MKNFTYSLNQVYTHKGKLAFTKGDEKENMGNLNLKDLRCQQ